MSIDICSRFDVAGLDTSLNIGYSHSRVPFLVLSILTLVLNLIVIIYSIRKSSKSTNEDASMEKMFLTIYFLQFFNSLLWVINASVLYSVSEIQNNCNVSFTFSLINIFIFCVLFEFHSFNFHTLNVLVNNPIEGVFRFRRLFSYYIIISIVVSGVIVILCYFAELFGISPMLTCFIRNYYVLDKTVNKFRTFSTITLLLIVIFAIIFNIYTVVKIIKSSRKKPQFVRNFVYKNLTTGLIYMSSFIPILILYGISFNKIIYKNTFQSWMSYFTSIVMVSIDFAYILAQIIFKQTKIYCLNEVNMIQDENKENENLILKYPTVKRVQDQLISNLLRDLLIGICQSMSSFKRLEINSRFRKRECYSMKEFIIRKNNVTFNDPTLTNAEDFKIKFTSYGREVFKRLLWLEKLNEDEFLESLLPSKNVSTISESQGKSGNFFISTDDNKLILKTISKEEVSLIKNNFLKKYYLHLLDNQDSILSRIYGLYQIRLGSDVINVILMRNCIGNLKQNILCKYDLKGSSLNRDIKVDLENLSGIVMKDNNFTEIEKYLRLSSTEKDKLKTVCYNDSKFLSSLEVMDYSLLAIKLTLSSEEYNQIFVQNKQANENLTPTSSRVQFKNFAIEQHLYPSVSRNQCYIFAIIDYFQIYNFLKFIETGYKYIITSSVKYTDISSVPPDVYMKRFNDFVARITEFSEEELIQKDEKITN